MSSSRSWSSIVVGTCLVAAVSTGLGGTSPSDPPSGTPSSVDQPTAATGQAEAYEWNPVRIGGGGYISGLSIADDGALLARSDTYGAYLRPAGSQEWRQVLTTAALPGDWHLPKLGKGTYEVAIAPSDSNRLYVVWSGHVFVSSDGGASLTETAYVATPSDANAPFGRGFGDKMAVDPVNADVVLAGGPDVALRRSADGGRTWSDTNVPVGRPTPELADATAGEISSVGTTGVAFDRSSGDGSVSPVVYAASWGNGVFRSSDNGASWSSIGGPDHVIHAGVGAEGRYYALSGSNAGDFGVQVYDGSSWSDVTPGDWDPGSTVASVENPFMAVDPTAPGHVVIGHGSQMFETSDGGDRWDDRSWTWTGDGDVTWLNATEVGDDNPYLVAGDLVFDPVRPDQVWLATGTGVGVATVADTFEWTMSSRGIENMVATDIATMRGGGPVFGVFDFGQFSGSTDFDDYSLVKGPIPEFAGTTSLSASPFADCTAVSATTDYVQFDSYPISSASTDDCGATWHVFDSMPRDAASAAEFGYGAIAVGEATDIVWAPGRYGSTQSSDFQPYVTNDGGSNWQTVELPGVDAYPEDAIGGYMFGPNRQLVAADGATPGTFYIYMVDQGVFRSTDRGATWVRVFEGNPSEVTPGVGQLDAQPGAAGSLFYSDGPLGGHDYLGAQDDLGTPFLRSRDGGATWEPVAGVSSVLAFGFGSPAPDGTAATIYLAGHVNETYGIWRSTDDGVTWEQIGDYPVTVDWVTSISGDADEFGLVYVGFTGSSFVYGRPG